MTTNRPTTETTGRWQGKWDRTYAIWQPVKKSSNQSVDNRYAHLAIDCEHATSVRAEEERKHNDIKQAFTGGEGGGKMVNERVQKRGRAPRTHARTHVFHDSAWHIAMNE